MYTLCVNPYCKCPFLSIQAYNYHLLYCHYKFQRPIGINNDEMVTRSFITHFRNRDLEALSVDIISFILNQQSLTYLRTSMIIFTNHLLPGFGYTFCYLFGL